jgi:hypothetical protein
MASRIGTVVQKGVVLTLFTMTIGGVGLLAGGLYKLQEHKVRAGAAHERPRAKFTLPHQVPTMPDDVCFFCLLLC